MRENEFHQGAIAAEDSLLMARGPGASLAVVAGALVGILVVLGLLSAEATEPFVLSLMAFLATLGVFFLFGLAAGHVRIGEGTVDADIAAALARGFSDGLCITTLQGRRIYVNTAFEETLGRSEYGHSGTLEQLFAGEPQAAEALFRLSRAAARRESRTEEFRVKGVVDGQRHSRWYRLSVSSLDLPRGNIDLGPLVLWRIIDVTDERRREAETLRTLEATLSQYESLPLGLFVTLDDDRIEHLNATLAQWLGLSTATIAHGLKLSDIVAADGAALLRTMAREEGDGARRVDVDLICEGGRIWPATLIVTPRAAAAGKAGAFSAAVMERAADEDLAGPGRPAEVRFARFFQSAPFGIATVADDGRIVSANAAFSRLLLDSRGGQGARALDVLSRAAEPDIRDLINSALADALAGKSNVQPIEITLGEARDLTRRVFFSPLAGNSGSLSAILYVIDATEEKALEVKFAQSQKMEAVGKLAGGIAHDFNNVLTAIIGFSDLLLQTHRPRDPAYNNIKNIKSSAERAADLVSQLLAFSRRQTLQPVVLQLSERLTDLSVLLNRSLGEKIELKILPARDLWYIKADPAQLDQVVINLAVNARDAMPEGGLLTIRTRNVGERESQKFERQGLPVGEYVLIEVEDRGHGMTPEVQEKIFEPFFTTKGVGKGTGLGLSRVYGIVKQTGGYVLVESTVGKGTTFRVYLPRHELGDEDDVETQKSIGRERQGDMTGSGRVLLVEDEDAVRNFAFEALKRQGYEVLQASTGAEALEVMHATDRPVDIVVSDVIMPEMDGPTMYKVLRDTSPDLKIIFMSGYPDDAFKNALDADVKFAFLQKPFSLAQLASKVKEELLR